ncbi:MAG: hypothetical protein A2X26_03640 [Chloroflexi bacterium GWC2_49_37]|nr:MAG: hypothetical protein A2X26_03640 [Chloroflexi bacterium GWC2_49_37]
MGTRQTIPAQMINTTKLIMQKVKTPRIKILIKRLIFGFFFPVDFLSNGWLEFMFRFPSIPLFILSSCSFINFRWIPNSRKILTNSQIHPGSDTKVTLPLRGLVLLD